MSAPAMRGRPSPNRGPRPPGAVIDTLVLHYTGMETAAAALERLCDPAAQVSAHYMIDEDGAVWRLVDESMRAWHAGLGFWRGATDLNDRSIGIELTNPGHEFGYRPFPEAQMAALVALAGDICARHAIAPARVLGHSDVAPLRKQDPGELFDWTRLADAGLAVRPVAAAEKPVDTATSAVRLLAAIGYDVDGISAGRPVDEDAALLAAIAAFQRRFRPARVDGVLDDETVRLIAATAPLFEGT